MYESNVENFSLRRGKVRDVYELGENILIIVTTDRVSAFDWVFPNTIPDKGKILQKMSIFWANHMDGVYYHMITDNIQRLPASFQKPEFNERTMMVERTQVVPFECVVRGYLCGSAWKEYKETGEVTGIKMPSGLKENSPLPYPIFTPATKEESGHDINVSFEQMIKYTDMNTATELRENSIEIYLEAAQHAWERGIIIADTKFEWGLHPSGELILIDEVLTADSSRYWPVEEYALDKSIPSFDKQFLRDWVSSTNWDKNSPPPVIPNDIIEKTREKYWDIYNRLIS